MLLKACYLDHAEYSRKSEILEALVLQHNKQSHADLNPVSGKPSSFICDNLNTIVASLKHNYHLPELQRVPVCLIKPPSLLFFALI